MKKILFSLALLCMSAASFAQNSLVATLTHEGDITMFNGAKALVDAHAAAVSGDIITLSSGQFDNVTITKAISLRGAGCERDTNNGIEATHIGGMTINIPESVTNSLSCENIKFQSVVLNTGKLNNAMFKKCSFSNGYADGTNGTTANVNFVQCYIYYNAYGQTTRRCGIYLANGSKVNCINSYVYWPNNLNDTSSFSFLNCYVAVSVNGTNINIYNSLFVNSILYDTNKSTAGLHRSNVVEYCLGLYTNIFNNVLHSTSYIDTGTIFKTGYFCVMTDEAKSKYLGNDGTQVGLYGGTMPYSTKPDYPRIIKCNVANKASADGKISVDIEVETAE